MANVLNFETYLNSLNLEQKQVFILKDFYNNYKKAGLCNGIAESCLLANFKQLAHHVSMQMSAPFSFEPFHEAIFSPTDYYQFGIDFMKILVENDPLIKGEKQLEIIQQRLLCGENVILLANHQTEADPQFLSIALEKHFPHIAKNMIFVAGERVTHDPLAVPFSKGRNLLCIYSKRYIDHPLELKLQKQLHNKKTMEKMAELLKIGSQIIYVAPSGGRDRKNEQGLIEVAPFDSQSIEMFILMSKRAKTPTHFHTLALSTYNLLPPPEGIQKELGETRSCHQGPIGFYFGEAIDLEKYADISDKHIARQQRADELTQLVKEHYKDLL